jgi:hypothetical protein
MTPIIYYQQIVRAVMFINPSSDLHVELMLSLGCFQLNFGHTILEDVSEDPGELVNLKSNP